MWMVGCVCDVSCEGLICRAVFGATIQFFLCRMRVSWREREKEGVCLPLPLPLPLPLRVFVHRNKYCKQNRSEKNQVCLIFSNRSECCFESSHLVPFESSYLVPF